MRESKMIHSAPTSTRVLYPSERRFLDAMRWLGFGRFEFLKVRDGELVLEPWPKTICDVKFGVQREAELGTTAEDFALKLEVLDFFKYLRSVKAGEIRTLEIRYGLPFTMTIEESAVSATEPARSPATAV